MMELGARSSLRDPGDPGEIRDPVALYISADGSSVYGKGRGAARPRERPIPTAALDHESFSRRASFAYNNRRRAREPLTPEPRCRWSHRDR